LPADLKFVSPLVVSHFVVKKRVEFHQTDLAGIVHFSEFFRYFESAEHAMFRSLGTSVHPSGTDSGWPRVSCSFDYHRPLRFEDEFEVRVEIQRIGKSSLTLSCEIHLCGPSSADESLIAKGQSTSVHCLKSHDGKMQTEMIPASVRSKLEELLATS